MPPFLCIMGIIFMVFVFFCLTVTSLWIHFDESYYNNQKLVMLDKISIFLVASVGFFVFYCKTTKCMSCMDAILACIIVATFVGTVVLYYYGYITNQFVFCEDREMAKKWHIIMHVIGSLGHHLIILL